MRVLVVEDEVYLADAIRTGLSRESFAVDVVYDGEAALDKLSVSEYDAVVLDRDLPRGCLAAYYPEANVLVSLDDHDARSGTPAYKSVPVRLRAHVVA